MSDKEAEKVFVRLRWQDNSGDAYCPHCGCLTVYSCPRPNGAPRWRCKACRKDFSVTSGTLFASHKMPLRLDEVRVLSAKVCGVHWNIRSIERLIGYIGLTRPRAPLLCGGACYRIPDDPV
jgi:transposase-like protein